MMILTNIMLAKKIHFWTKLKEQTDATTYLSFAPLLLCVPLRHMMMAR